MTCTQRPIQDPDLQLLVRHASTLQESDRPTGNKISADAPGALEGLASLEVPRLLPAGACSSRPSIAGTMGHKAPFLWELKKVPP